MIRKSKFKSACKIQIFKEKYIRATVKIFCRVSQIYVCSLRVDDRSVRILYLYRMLHCNLPQLFFKMSQSTHFLSSRRRDETV